jgi:hypothetical protein
MSSIRLIREVVLVAMLAVSASCGVTTDNQSVESDPSESTETATQPETQVTVPEDLELIAPRAACNRANEACVPLGTCTGHHGILVSATCPAHTQCCRLPPG